MSLKSYKVFTRTRGNFEVQAYSRRHAVCIVVVQLGLFVDETKEVSGWAVSEMKEG